MPTSLRLGPTRRRRIAHPIVPTHYARETIAKIRLVIAAVLPAQARGGLPWPPARRMRRALVTAPISQTGSSGSAAARRPCTWRQGARARMLLALDGQQTRRVALLAAGLVIGLGWGPPLEASWPDKPPAAGSGRAVAGCASARRSAGAKAVEREYVEPVDDHHQLLQAAIRGMVSSLDPYSAYLDGDEYDDIVVILRSGQYSGVGIEVSME